MGIINQGILGGFSGKVGPIVGFRWKSNYYIRARAAKVSNPRTPKQQERRYVLYSEKSRDWQWKRNQD